jgi:glycosyltransferase involved in cell wall biosynthesis
MAIKVFIQTDRFEGGPAIFRSRLISALNKFDNIEIVTNISKKFDIELAFIRKVFKHNKPYILRVDGCYYEKSRKQSNVPLVEAIKKAQYVIFQSYFSLKLCKHVLDLGHKIQKEAVDYSVVYNGIDLNYIDKIKPAAGIEPGSFISCAGWRPNKRPSSTIKGFLKADTGRHLYMVGGSGFVGSKIDKKYNSKYIHLLGEKTNEETISIMKACDYQMHLCHIDSCPNSVVEGLTCGLNVLCTNLGGTPELVKDNGIILDVDQFWDKQYLNVDNLDNLSSRAIADGVKRIIKSKKKIDPSFFDIGKVAVKYKNIIENIVSR